MNKKRYLSHSAIVRLMLSAMFIAIGIVLPFFTGQIQQIGNLLLPMHLPVFFPNAVAMAVELLAYGFVSGLIYGILKHRNILSTYIAILPAMIFGRIAWGIMQIILLGIQNNKFTWQMFMAGAFLNAIPGIILQLVIIPLIMTALHFAGILRFNGKADGERHRKAGE